MAAVLEPSTPRWDLFSWFDWRAGWELCMAAKETKLLHPVSMAPGVPISAGSSLLPPPLSLLSLRSNSNEHPIQGLCTCQLQASSECPWPSGFHPAPMPDFVPSFGPRSVSFLPLPQLMSGKLELLPTLSSAVQSLHPFPLSSFLTFSPSHHQRTYPTPPAFSRLHLDCAPPSRFNTPPTPWRLHLPPLRRALRRRPRPQH